jgi:hypothetical protein
MDNSQYASQHINPIVFCLQVITVAAIVNTAIDKIF